MPLSPVVKDEVKAVIEEQLAEQRMVSQIEALKAQDEQRQAEFKAQIEAEEK